MSVIVVSATGLTLSVTFAVPDDVESDDEDEESQAATENARTSADVAATAFGSFRRFR